MRIAQFAPRWENILPPIDGKFQSVDSQLTDKFMTSGHSVIWCVSGGSLIDIQLTSSDSDRVAPDLNKEYSNRFITASDHANLVCRLSSYLSQFFVQSLVNPWLRQDEALSLISCC
jgi:hypothetical protein